VAQRLVDASGASGPISEILLEKVARIVASKDAGRCCPLAAHRASGMGRYEGEKCVTVSEYGRDGVKHFLPRKENSKTEYDFVEMVPLWDREVWLGFDYDDLPQMHEIAQEVIIEEALDNDRDATRLEAMFTDLIYATCKAASPDAEHVDAVRNPYKDQEGDTPLFVASSNIGPRPTKRVYTREMSMMDRCRSAIRGLRELRDREPRSEEFGKGMSQKLEILEGMVMPIEKRLERAKGEETWRLEELRQRGIIDVQVQLWGKKEKEV